MFFYAGNVGRFPDELEHISYIAYLEKTHTIIPNFKDMKMLEDYAPGNAAPNIVNSQNITNQKYIFGNAFNYLGHPPLYYHIMRLSGAVHIDNNTITVNLIRLRSFNIVLNALTFLFILYIGYSRIGKNPLLHLLYAAIVVSVPMLAYVCAGINNDNLALLGVSIFMLGLLRFSEKKRTFPTYLLISIGVFLSFMSKLTAGLVVFISLLTYIIFIIIKERNLNFLISKKFLATLPVYFAAVFYYLVVFFQTGSILPTYRILNPQGFYASGFYVEISKRIPMDFYQYSTHFIHDFLGTWTGIASYVSLLKSGSIFSLDRIVLVSLLFIPILLLFQIKNASKKYPIILAAFSVYLGLVISIITQVMRAYNEFAHISGYLGGYQSRYYLCGISAIALSIVLIFKNLLNEEDNNSVINIDFENRLTLRYPRKRKSTSYALKKFILYSISIFLIVMLFYEDFIYFLINFKDYI